MAVGESMPGPRSTSKGVPSRSQKGRSMKPMPLQQVAHRVWASPVADRQTTQTGG